MSGTPTIIQAITGSLTQGLSGFALGIVTNGVSALTPKDQPPILDVIEIGGHIAVLGAFSLMFKQWFRGSFTAYHNTGGDLPFILALLSTQTNLTQRIGRLSTLVEGYIRSFDIGAQEARDQVQ